MLPPDLQNKDLTDMLPEVEDFTINELLCVKQRWFPRRRKRKEIAAKIARYSGISESSDAK
jgi:hypothetical protein